MGDLDLFSYFDYNDARYFIMTPVNLDMLYVSYAHMPCCFFAISVHML